MPTGAPVARLMYRRSNVVEALADETAVVATVAAAPAASRAVRRTDEVPRCLRERCTILILSRVALVVGR